MPLDDVVAFFETRAIDLVALDEALQTLAAVDPRHLWGPSGALAESRKRTFQRFRFAIRVTA